MKLILTIVGFLIPIVAASAPRRDEVPLNEATEAPAESQKPPLEKSETVDVSIPPPPEKPTTPIEIPGYMYDHAMGLKGSLLVRGRNEEGELDLPTSFGVFYRGPFPRNMEAEYSISMVSDALGLLEIEPIYYFSHDSLRIYAKPGLAIFLDPSELLTTLWSLDNYALQGAVGLEDMLYRPLSVKIEFGFRAGLENSEAFFTLGYSWSW